MSYASPPLVSEGKKNTSAENVVSRVGATSWKNIFHAVAVLLDECLVQQKTGGAVIVPNGKFASPTDVSPCPADTLVPRSSLAETANLDDICVRSRLVF